ncbi:MAG TPA: prepilin-type N-terminal cleavage/methylation domain-containing protein [Patescibacteria group bacterium]|nr:prepilin-type N-terminal cleavage/methylation domain-containing protein [Patescibacteria group bacterium]
MKQTAGFTLIELLIVFSVTAILSSIGIASFLSYSRSQDLRESTYNLQTYLQTARADVLAQVKPAGLCGGPLQSYEVFVCCKGGGSNCPICKSSDNIELDISCGGSTHVVMSKSFPSDVIIDNINTTNRSFVFTPISGIVSGLTSNASIVLQGKAVGSSQQNATITVTTTGVIQ